MTHKVLVVDDNKGDRQLINEALKELPVDCETIMASSGEEGIAKAVEFRPDLVILDMEMSGLDGLDVCKKIREIEGLGAKIVLMTGVAGAVHPREAKIMGADMYCAKSFDNIYLKKVLCKAFDLDET